MAVLSQICCFGKRKMVMFQILLDGAEPCYAGTTQLSSPVCRRGANRILLASALSSMRIICPNKVSRRDWIIAVSLGKGRRYINPLTFFAWEGKCPGIYLTGEMSMGEMFYTLAGRCTNTARRRRGQRPTLPCERNTGPVMYSRPTSDGQNNYGAGAESTMTGCRSTECDGHLIGAAPCHIIFASPASLVMCRPTASFSAVHAPPPAAAASALPYCDTALTRQAARIWLAV